MFEDFSSDDENLPSITEQIQDSKTHSRHSDSNFTIISPEHAIEKFREVSNFSASINTTQVVMENNFKNY